MNRKHIFSINEFYHVYNRGVDKRIIFQDTSDYHRFILLLYFCNSNKPVDSREILTEGRTFGDLFYIDIGEPLVAVGAWCLMPNHFHVLIKELTQNGITKFIQKVTTGYSMYFNKKYKRNGTLFQGKFKSEHATDDNYLKYLFSYIHLNPIKLLKGESKWKEEGIQNLDSALKFLETYQYSSLSSYMKDNSIYQNILQKDEFPLYFSNQMSHFAEIAEWLNYQDPINSTKVRPS